MTVFSAAEHDLTAGIDMELYHLRTFVTVAEEGHLTRAAKRLHISQPSVSAHIKALEEELGVNLFTRTPRGMEVTDQGRRLMDRARAALDAADGVLREAAHLRDRLTGELRLGVNTESEFLRVVEAVDALAGNHPGIKVDLVQTTSDLVPGLLRTGSLDASFICGNAVEPDLEGVRITDMPLSIAGPAAWADRIRGADIEAIAALPWIWMSHCCPLCLSALEHFQGLGLEPHKVLVTNDETAVKAMVRAGKGMGVLRRDEARELEEAGAAVAWDGPELSVPLWFCILARRGGDPLLTALTEAVRSVWEPRAASAGTTATA